MSNDGSTDDIEGGRDIPNGRAIPTTPPFMINTGNMARFHL